MHTKATEEDIMRIPNWLTRRARIELVCGDITKQHVDAIVNAAKASLLGGGGVDGAIHRAGGPAILAECKTIRACVYPEGLPTGNAVPTTGGMLPAKWVIHTVGPMYGNGAGRTVHNAKLLRDCYANSLHVADHLGARTVAFPLISSGVYGWPTDDAIRQAITAIRRTRTRVRTARLVLFDQGTLSAARIIANL
jgi:O-acetyl-ADP-ribose deacetylase (regulator of RNase III)